MNGTLIACQVETIQTRRDGSMKVVIGTQEISPSKGSELLGLRNKIVAVYIAQKETMSESEMKQVDAIDVDLGGKTQSQRIRNVLYKLFEQDSEGHKIFDTYYREKTELFISTLKSNIKD